MKLTNLKLTKKEKKDTTDAPSLAGTSSYPYGLEVRLETESINKLGLNIQSFKIGEKVKIEADTEVIEISNNESEDGNRKTIRLQIQNLGLSKGKSKIGKYNDTQKAGPE